MHDAGYVAKTRQGFAVDAWLANWDVAGLEFDNIVSDYAIDPVRVDQGGCLLYRAMGALKGKAFDTRASEWETLRDFVKAPQAAHLFADITTDELEQSAGKVWEVTPSAIAEAVMGVGFDQKKTDDLIFALNARRHAIIKKAIEL
jgi:hypothetical protein